MCDVTDSPTLTQTMLNYFFLKICQTTLKKSGVNNGHFIKVYFKILFEMNKLINFNNSYFLLRASAGKIQGTERVN